MEKIPSRNKNQEQGDLFSGESLKKYCDPRSPEFLDRLTDVVLSRMEFEKKNGALTSPSVYLTAQQLLTDLKLDAPLDAKTVADAVEEKIEERNKDAAQNEMTDLMSAKIRSEADARWPEEGKKDEDIPYWIKQDLI